ncbi:hypothetical protein [Kitasatospora sp. NPDC101183]|uniref:hypothetical protein n=1 Tax=Kitasatospora sp. NPDC101183 TaxID=3364100 RepID=UPI003826076A
MATSDGWGRKVLEYLESTRNLVASGCGVAGVGLHYLGLGGSWWPGVIVGLYGAGALLTPGPRGPGKPDGPDGPGGPTTPIRSERPATRAPEPRADPELASLEAYVASAPLPASARVAELLASLREARPGPEVRRMVRHRLPVAVDGYLRARTWRPWAGPDAPDPAAELGRVVAELSAELTGVP